MQKNVVSFITPTFNRHNELKKNYDILSKIYKKNKGYFEWIIVSEKKDFKTQNLIKNFNKKFVKNFPGVWKGTEKAFKFGIKQSQSYLIKFHGDDDYLAEDLIVNLKKEFKKNILWYAGQGVYINQNEEIRSLSTFIKNRFLLFNNKNLIYLVNYFFFSSVLVQKKYYLTCKFTEKDHFSDYYLYINLIKLMKPKIINKIFCFNTFNNRTKTGTFDIDRYLLLSNYIRKNVPNNFLLMLHFLSISFVVIYNFFKKKLLKF